MDQLFVILCIIAVTFVLMEVDPRLDYNYETEERILWYNDILNGFTRKFITLWKVVKK